MNNLEMIQEVELPAQVTTVRLRRSQSELWRS